MYGVEQNVNEPALIVERVLKDGEKRKKMQDSSFVQTLTQKGRLKNKGKRMVQKKGSHCPLYILTPTSHMCRIMSHSFTMQLFQSVLA